MTGANGQGPTSAATADAPVAAATPRDERSRAIATRTAALAGALGALLSPIPLADELVLVPVYAFMASRIGRVHRLTLRKIPWRPLARTTVTALGVRAGLNLAFALLPGVAAVANATSAVTLTMLLGKWFDEACSDPANAEAISPAAILASLEQTIERAIGRRPA
jgi:uncharacterized protein (DUF697 family)